MVKEEDEMRQEATIRFYVAGCMEYERYAKVYENLTLPQAVDTYIRIRKQNAGNGPGIGFVLEDKNLEDYSGINWPLYMGNEIARDEIALIPAFENHPLVQQAVAEMEQYLPKLEKAQKQRTQIER